ncbi:MAG: ATP-binding protein [Anaerolineales bacterium]|nr:ATP-binding protein [Anaerolineales bacterium]
MANTEESLGTESQTLAEQREIIRKLSRLLEISVTLNSTLDPKRLLRFILDTATDVLECEGASIMLYDEKRGELFFTAATPSDANEMAKIPVPLEGSIAGTVFSENRPLIINNVEEDPRHFGLVANKVGFQPSSLVGVPMRIRDKTTGVLEALNKTSGRFSQKDAQYLYVIASQAAAAIHNANLLQELQRSYDEASKLDELRSNFLAIASHELRTPLGLILGYATFLEERAEGDLSKHAGLVVSSALRMQTLIEDMTNMNLLKVGASELDTSVIPIQGAVEEAEEAVKPAAVARNQTITISMPRQPVFVRADQEKIVLVIINLLNNAVRFTPEGGKIHLTVVTTRNEARVEIQDNGRGIPPDELENIFKEFYQLEDHMTRRYGGLGLGLAIAKGLLELHGGYIWAESEGVGKGSTFIFTLPLE